VAKKSSAAKPVKDDAAAPAKLKFYYPVLGGCELERNLPPDGAGDAKVERFYDSTIQMSDQTDDADLAVCQFSAGQKIKETRILEIRATYFVGLRFADANTEGEIKSAMQEFVAASAWPMFRDLFIHIGSQSGEELPLLPNAPKLRWISPAVE
jgi:hypothetical protein